MACSSGGLSLTLQGVADTNAASSPNGWEAVAHVQGLSGPKGPCGRFIATFEPPADQRELLWLASLNKHWGWL